MAKISKSQLEKLQKKYKTDDAIGKLFGVTRQAIHQLRTKYGIPPVADKNKDRNQEIIQLYTEGMAGTQIARKHKISISQAYRIINEQMQIETAAPKNGSKKTSKSKAKVSSKKV